MIVRYSFIQTPFHLHWSPLFSDFLVNFPEFSSELVNLNCVLQGLLQKVVVMSNLQQMFRSL